MSDEFFDDEEELMEQAASESAPRVKASSRARLAAEASQAPVPASPAPSTSSRRTPPPFWMVLLIAAIALLLGVVIGYLAGSSATLQALSAQDEAAQEQLASAEDGSAYELPEGHPDVEVDTDGTAHVADGGSSADSE